MAQAAADALEREHKVTATLRRKVQELQEAYDGATRASTHWQEQLEEAARAAAVAAQKLEQRESRCRALQAEVQEVQLSQDEQQRKMTDYRADIATKMQSVQAHLEKLRVERAQIVEENRVLEGQLAQRDAALADAKARHERTLAEVLAAALVDDMTHFRDVGLPMFEEEVSGSNGSDGWCPRLQVAAEHINEMQQLEADHQDEIKRLGQRVQECQVMVTALTVTTSPSLVTALILTTSPSQKIGDDPVTHPCDHEAWAVLSACRSAR